MYPPHASFSPYDGSRRQFGTRIENYVRGFLRLPRPVPLTRVGEMAGRSDLVVVEKFALETGITDPREK